MVAGLRRELSSDARAWLSRSWRRYAVHVRVLWLAGRAPFVACVALCLATAGATSVGLIASGQLVGQLNTRATTAEGGDRVWLWFWVTTSLLLVALLAQVALTAASTALTAQYLTCAHLGLAEVGLHARSVERFSDDGFVASVERLKDALSGWGFVSGATYTWRVLTVRLCGVGALILVVRWQWWVAALALPAYAIQSRAFSGWLTGVLGAGSADAALEAREAAYARSILTSTAYAKEVRLFGLRTEFLDRFQRHYLRTRSAVDRGGAGTQTMISASIVSSVGVNAIAIGFAVHQGRDGSIGVASATTLVQAIIALRAFGPLGDTQVSLTRTTAVIAEVDSMRSREGLSGMSWLTPSRQPSGSTPSSRPTVALDSVTFRYPKMQTPVLEGLSLSIDPGQIVGIVGRNGAGKSTVVKLICGLHRPESGSVLVGAEDPASDQEARRRIAGAFQNFVRLPASLRENVMAGVSQVDDESEVFAYAVEAVQLGEITSRLPRGADTLLSPHYEGGVALSGGEWQRVALARLVAMRRAGADVLILDEPSAALDLRAEQALFTDLVRLRAGATTLLVSHRLAAMRLCDRVLVLDRDETDGSVIAEDGSHASLLEAGGLYATMFRAQSRRFASDHGACG